MKKPNLALAVILARKCLGDILDLTDPIVAEKDWAVTTQEDQLDLIRHIATRDSAWAMESIEPELREFVRHLHEIRANDPKLRELLEKPFLRRVFGEPWSC